MKKRILSLLLAVGILFSVSAGASVSAAEAANGAVGTAKNAAGYLDAAPVFRVYISPSPQYDNLYPNGKTEEDYMRQIAQQMALYLKEYGVETIIAPSVAEVPKNQWGQLMQMRAQAASLGACDLYLSLHSNASSEGQAGQHQGTYIYYQTTMPMSRYWAQIVQKNFIYPNPDRIKLANNQDFTEMNTPTMPSLLVQTAFHDNKGDADWITHNVQRIAANLSYSIAEYRKQYYGVPIRAITDPNLQVPFLRT